MDVDLSDLVDLFIDEATTRCLVDTLPTFGAALEREGLQAATLAVKRASLNPAHLDAALRKMADVAGIRIKDWPRVPPSFTDDEAFQARMDLLRILLLAADSRGVPGRRRWRLQGQDAAIEEVMAARPPLTLSEVARQVGISRATLYRALSRRKRVS